MVGGAEARGLPNDTAVAYSHVDNERWNFLALPFGYFTSNLNFSGAVKGRENLRQIGQICSLKSPSVEFGSCIGVLPTNLCDKISVVYHVTSCRACGLQSSGLALYSLWQSTPPGDPRLQPLTNACGAGRICVYSLEYCLIKLTKIMT